MISRGTWCAPRLLPRMRTVWSKCGRSATPPDSVYLQVYGAHDLTPLRIFDLQILGVLFGVGGHHVSPYPLERGLHFRLLQKFADLTVYATDHRGRRAAGRENAGPQRSVVARQRFGDARNIRNFRRAFGARD